MKEILPSDPDRWFIARSSSLVALFGLSANINSVSVFGGVPNNTRLSTGQSILEVFATEEELESKINTMAGDPNYYENAVTTGDPRYNGESGIYGPYDPPPPEPPE